MMLIRLDAKRYLTFALMLLVAMLLSLSSARTANSALLDTAFIGNSVSGPYNPTTNGYINENAPLTVNAAAGDSSITVGTRVNSGYATNSTGGSFVSTAVGVNFGSGRLIMIIQSQGYAGTANSGDQNEIDLTNNQTGQWEIARITGTVGSGSSNTVNLTAPLANSYKAPGAQIVSIPEFTTVTLAANRTLSARPWDGSSGGVLAFLASGAVTLASTASLNANAAGFRGGIKTNFSGNPSRCTALDDVNSARKGESILPASSGYYNVGANTAISQGMGNRANGSGGGDCSDAGGGGGSNGGFGGRGGKSWDSGTAQYSVGGFGGQKLTYSALNHAVFGGGGGGGHGNNNAAGRGGAGGGIVFVRGLSLSAAGATISANGEGRSAGEPTTNSISSNTGASGDGAGGGGGGGVVYARFTGTAACGSVAATGGNGGNDRSTPASQGPGGGGGGGRVLLQSAGGACTTSSIGGIAGTTNTPDYRGASPVVGDEDLVAGETETADGALVKPTATTTIPTEGQTRPITSSVSGTVTPAAAMTVRVYVDGAFKTSVISDASGNWQYTTDALPTGSHSVYVIPVHLGIAGDQSTTRNFTVDATAPAAPSITNPAGALLTNNATPTISGTSEGLATITFYDGATQLAGSATATGGGAWSFTLPTLTYGVHQITARATDPYNNQGPASASRAITYDNVPAVLTVGSPAEGSFLNTLTPSFTFSSNKPGSSTCQVDAATPGPCTSPWSVPSGAITAQGAHSVTVRWTDSAGNVTPVTRSFTVDTIQPSLSIYSPATDGTIMSSSRPAIGFTMSDTNASAASECRVDSSSWTSCDSPWTTPTLTDGTHLVEVRHTDKAGNVRTVQRSIGVDTTLPVVSISTPANSSFTGPTPTVNFSVTDVNPGTSFCQMDGGAENPCTTGSVWPSALGAGSHTLAVRHEDAAGNKGATTSVTFTVDTTAPVVSITAPTAGQLVNTSSPQVTFTVTEANPSPTSSCKIDSGAAVPCTSPYVAAGLSQGSHTLTVSHTDKAGNSDSGSTAVRSFTVDSIAPVAPTFGSGPGGVARLTNQTNATFTFTAAETGVGHLECQIDGAGWDTNCTSPQSFAGLPVGEHSFFVRQVDDAGNLGQIGTHTWTIDQTPPPAPNVSGPSGVSGAPVENFSFYNAEQGVTFTCQLDAATPVACNSLSFTTGTLSDGPHSFSVISTDPAGNDSAPTTLNWTTNSAQFSVAITAGPPPLSNTPSGDFNFSATIFGATFTCTLDGQTVSCPSSPYHYSSLADGPHTFSVYASQGGNDSPTVTRNWTIDATPPQLDVVWPPDGGTTGGDLQIDFTATDTGGSVSTTCKLDAAPAVPCSDSHALNNLSGGSHTLLIEATDAAGNVTADSRTWTVDVTPPSTTFTSTPPVATNSGSASFSFISSKSPNTFECSLDGAAFSTCTSPAVLSVAPGVHTFQARAIAYGNVDPAPATYTWQVDTVPPTVPTITSGARVLSGGTVTLRGTSDPDTEVELLLTINQTLQGSAETAPNGNWDLVLSSVPDGIFEVCARAVDAAGNTSDCSAPVTVVVDSQPPTVAISSPADSSLVSSNVIAFSGSDTTSEVRFECEVADLTTGDEPAFELCSPPTFAPNLVSGHQYTVTVHATDELENDATAAVTFTFDNTPPARPTITSPAADGATSAAPVSIGGDAEAGSTVTVYVDGTPRPATTTAGGGGSWNYTFSPDLPERAQAYEIHVVALDSAGNESQASISRNITVDRTAPAKPVIASPASGSGTSNSKPAISGTAEPNAALRLTIDSSDVDLTVSGAGTWTYTPSVALANGSHTVSAKATDVAGNESPASDGVTFTVDNSPPTVAISSPLGGEYFASTSVTVQFTATDNDSFSVVCTLDGDPVTPCAAPSKALTGLGQGDHTFNIQATDVGGNVATASVGFTIDTVAPNAPVISQPVEGSYISGGVAPVSGTAEPGSTVHLALSGGPSVDVQASSPSGSWSHTFGGLSDGGYTVTAVAEDVAGNSSSSTQRNFTIDGTAPTAVTIDAPTDGAEFTSLGTVSGHGAEPGAQVSATIGSDPHTTTADGSGNWSIALSPSVTAEGLLTIAALQTDAAGNVSPQTSVTVRIDSTQPELTITSPTDGSRVATATPQVAFTATDASSNITRECRVGSDSFAACTSPWTTSSLSDGSNTVEVRATDGAGNHRERTVTFIVDTIPPETQFTGALPGQSGNPDKSLTPTFAFSSNEAGATFRCSIDSGPYVTCTSPRTLEALTNGSHTFRVKAVDLAGNEDPTPAAWTWTVDSIAPAKPVITSPTDGQVIANSTPTIEGTAEPLSTVTVRIDGNSAGTTNADISGNWSFTPSSPLGDGPRTLTATATDAATNISPVSTAVHITLDVMSPTASITSKPSALSNSTTPTFEFSADESSQFRCKLDSAAEIDCGDAGFYSLTGSTTYSEGLSQGSHTFAVVAVDTSSNRSAAATWTWTIDSIAPAKPVISAPVTAALLTDSTPTISGTAEANSSLTLTIDSSTADVSVGSDGTWSHTPSAALADGSHTLSATATDAADNTSAASDVTTFTVDTTAPVGSVSQQAGSGLNGAKPVFLISANDPQANFFCSIDNGAAVSCGASYTPAQDLPAGAHTLKVTFTDQAGNSSQQSLGFTATSAPQPPAKPDPVPAACFPKGVTITDLSASGSKVKLTGFARLSYVGQTVSIYYKASSKKPVGKAVVSADGSFSAKFKAPKKKLWASKKTAYRVSIGAVATAWTQLTRRMATTTASYSGGKLIVKGAVSKPLYPKAKATVTARTGCDGPWGSLGTAKISSSGKFSLSLPYTPSTGVIFVRVAAVVGSKPKKPKALKTNSFVIPVIVK